MRGKAKATVKFCVKLDISVCDGWTRLEYFSFDAYNEAGNLKDMIESYRARTGRYPERVLADKIYRNREISAIVRLITFACPARLWDVREKMKYGTKNGIIRIRRIGLRWNGNSVWLSGNVDWV